MCAGLVELQIGLCRVVATHKLFGSQLMSPKGKCPISAQVAKTTYVVGISNQCVYVQVNKCTIYTYVHMYMNVV